MKKINIRTFGIVLTILGALVVLCGLFFLNDSDSIITGGGFLLIIIGLSAVTVGRTAQDNKVRFENCTFIITKPKSQTETEKELAEGFKKHLEIIDRYTKKTGLIQGIDIDGNLKLKKKFDEEYTVQKVGIRLVGDHYIAINIYDRKMQDEVYKQIAKPIEENGDDVIFILRDQDDRSLGGIIIYDTGEKKQ